MRISDWSSDVCSSDLLPVWAPFIIFDGLQIVLVYTLRSLGDQVVAGINSIIAYFLVTGGLGWALVHHGAGPMGMVYALGGGMLGAALLKDRKSTSRNSSH